MPPLGLSRGLAFDGAVTYNFITLQKPSGYAPTTTAVFGFGVVSHFTC